MRVFDVSFSSSGLAARLIAALFFLSAASAVHAQSDAGRAPRPAPARQTEEGARRSDLVFMTVSVADAANRYVTGLNQTAFMVFEDGVQQEILFFNNEGKEECSLYFLFDMSELPDDTASILIQGILEIYENSYALDDRGIHFFNIGTDPEAVVSVISSELLNARKNVRTVARPSVVNLDGAGLYEACSKVIQAASRSSAPRKAVLLISDRLDNPAQGDPAELYRQARKSDVMFNVVGVVKDKDLVNAPDAESHPVFVLNYLARLTGGYAHFTSNVTWLPNIFSGLGMRTLASYTIGYKPSRPLRDGKLHRVTVGIHAPRGFPYVYTHARTELVSEAPEPSPPHKR